MRQLAERQRPIRRVEYERLASEGFFENEHIELIRGVILEMTPQGVPHSACSFRSWGATTASPSPTSRS